MVLEVLVENALEVREAQHMGANQLLLVRNLMQDGGISPDLKTVQAVLDAARVPVSIMVRPDTENYAYEEKRRVRTLKILEFYWNNGIRNISFGAIHGRVMDWDLLEDAIAHGFTVNINLAFDHTQDLVKNYLELSMYPMVKSVVTRGQALHALEGEDNIRKLAELGKSLPILLDSTSLTPETLRMFLSRTEIQGIQFGMGARDGRGKFNYGHIEGCVQVMRNFARRNTSDPSGFRPRF